MKYRVHSKDPFFSGCEYEDFLSLGLELKNVFLKAFISSMYRSCEFTQFVSREWKALRVRRWWLRVAAFHSLVESPLQEDFSQLSFAFSVEVPLRTRRAEVWERVCIVTRLSYPYKRPSLFINNDVLWSQMSLNCEPRPQMLSSFGVWLCSVD